MSRAELLAAVALSVLGCSVRLDELPEQKPAEVLPLAEGCALLDGVWGRARHTELAGKPAWLVDSIPSISGAALLRNTSDEDPCHAPSSIAASSAWVSESAQLSALDLVQPAGQKLYFRSEEPAGFGIATFDETQAAFAPSAPLLWSGDRPNFGVAALEHDATTWAFGCRAARFLDADCWLAFAPSEDATDPSAYRYARGGGNDTAQPDEAFPLLSAGTTISVAFVPERQRYLMAYVPPLGDVIVLRTGLDIDGPWSAPVHAARCAIPASDPEAFCGDVTLHAELPRSGDEIRLSYALATFDGERRAAHPEAYWTRLVTIEIPRALP